MSSPQGKRDIVRLRTFADDVSRAQQEQGISAPEVAAVLPGTETQGESKGVLFKVKKKSLDIKDTAGQAPSLNEDGIQFDEEVAAKVADQAYEEQKFVKEAATTKDDTLTIRQTDSLEAIAERPKPKLSDFTIGAPSEPTIPSATAPATPTPKAQPAPQPPLTPPAAAAVSNPPALSTPVTSSAPTAPTMAPITMKAAETIDQIADAPRGMMTMPEVSGGDLQEGELVTDKKRERFKLMPAIGQAVTDWFTDTKETIEEAQREKHTVSRIEDRVETIKAAASQKTLAPDEDFAEVAKRLKEAKRTTADAPEIAIKPKQEVAPSWTHTIPEAGESAADVVTPVVETPPPQTPAPEPVPTPVTTPPVETPPTPPPEPVPTAATVLPTITPAFPTIDRGTGLTRPSTAGQAYVVPTAAAAGRTSPRELLPSPLLAMVVVIFAVVAGIGTSLFFFGQRQPVEVVPVATTNPLFTAELQTNIDMGTTHRETMGTLLSAVESRPGSLYMYLTRNNGADIVSPSEVMSLLAPQVPGSFARSVTNISFGSLDTRPFILLRVNNFDNAFSGMLAWEQTMSADLAPLFGPVVTESFDPQARTDNQARSAFFRDIVASNVSARLLANERGEDRIIYTFIDKQTILIATDRLQLGSIIPLIR